MVRSSAHATRSCQDIVLFTVAKCHGHLFIYYLAVDSGGHRSRKKHERHGELSLSNKRCSKANSWEEMVHGTERDHLCQRHSTVRIDLYWNVNERLRFGIAIHCRLLVSRYFIFTSFWAYKVRQSCVRIRTMRCPFRIIALDLLRLWIYVARLSHSCRCDYLCDHCGDVFLAQCRRLSMVKLFFQLMRLGHANVRRRVE